MTHEEFQARLRYAEEIAQLKRYLEYTKETLAMLPTVWIHAIRVCFDVNDHYYPSIEVGIGKEWYSLDWTMEEPVLSCTGKPDRPASTLTKDTLTLLCDTGQQLLEWWHENTTTHFGKQAQELLNDGKTTKSGYLLYG